MRLAPFDRRLAVLALALALAGCGFGQKARDHTLLPALRLSAPGVEQDAMHGVATLPEGERGDAQVQVATFFEALSAEPPDAAGRLLWPGVAALCEQGFQARLASGAIGPNVAGELRERVARFGEGISTYYREEQ